MHLEGRTHRLLAAGLVLAVLAALGGSRLAARLEAQDESQEPPVFRGGTAFVYVDAYPLRDGRPVEGLTASDFEVLEDGEPQRIETFQFVRYDTVVADADRRDPSTVGDSERQAADPRNRLFVVYLDPFHLRREDAVRAPTPVSSFFERTIGATDLVGVMTPLTPPSQLTFGRRLESLRSDLDQFWRNVPERDQPMNEVEHRLLDCAAGGFDQYPLILRLHREDTLLTSLEGLMHRLRGLREERTNVLFLSGGWAPSADPVTLTARGQGAIPTVGVGPTGRLGVGNQQPMGRDASWCDVQFARLSSGNYEQRFRDLLRLARQSNVSFYPVDVAGLQVSGSRRAQDTLLTLAENTNGLAITGTNDIGAGVERLTDSLSAAYLIGYYSTNSRADGRYREIRVRVRQPGVSVSARPGYFAPTEAMLAAVASAPAIERDSAVDDAVGRLARSSVDTGLFTYGARGPDGLSVVAELSSRSAGGGRGSDDAVLQVTATPASGPPHTAEVRVAPGERAVMVQLPLPATDTGPWRVVVTGTGDDGRIEGTYEVPAVERTLFAQPIPFRATPSPRSVPAPVADFSYRRQERIHVRWPLRQPLDERSARLLDRRGGELPVVPAVSDLAGEGGRGAAVAVDLPLSALAAGEYVLEIRGVAGGVTEIGLLAFRVVR